MAQKKRFEEQISRKKPAPDYSEISSKAAEFFEKLIKSNELSHNDILMILKNIKDRYTKDDIMIPISVFNNKELSGLEIISKYLKEELKLRFHEIAKLLNRDDRTIWATYDKASKKRRQLLKVSQSKFHFPTSIFKDRNYSVLEAIVFYLKNEYDLSFKEISLLLRKDPRNIWTVYNRYMKKSKQNV